MRNRNGYIGQIFDGNAIESIEDEVSPEEMIADNRNTEDKVKCRHQAYSSRLRSSVYYDSMSHQVSSVGSDQSGYSDTKASPWAFEDTSIMVENHSPPNPFILNAAPYADTRSSIDSPVDNSAPQAQLHRRPQTPYARRPAPSSAHIYRNPFDDAVGHAQNAPGAVESNRIPDPRVSSVKDDIIDDGENSSSAEDRDTETSNMTQVHVQESVRTDIGSEFVLGLEEKEEDTLMSDWEPTR